MIREVWMDVLEYKATVNILTGPLSRVNISKYVLQAFYKKTFWMVKKKIVPNWA